MDLKSKSIFDISVGDIIEFYEAANAYENVVTEVTHNSFKLKGDEPDEVMDFIPFSYISVEKTHTDDNGKVKYFLYPSPKLFGDTHPHPWRPRESEWAAYSKDDQIEILERASTFMLGQLRGIKMLSESPAVTRDIIMQNFWLNQELRKFIFSPTEIKAIQMQQLINGASDN